MRRAGNLFNGAFTRAALYEAYRDAARAKSGRASCFNFTRRLGANLDALYQEISTGAYEPRPYYTFVVHEPKTRTIYAPSFRDLVVQHAIYRAVGPVFEPSFIAQSFACRPGMGTHKASDYAQAALRASPSGSYTLKLDVRKFFYSIHRPTLRALIERKVKDRRFVDLMMAFADHGEPVGIPIGNLLSQLYALIYLSPLDHFIKRELKIRHYCRYVDDFILFGISRERAIECRARIEAFLAGLHLELSKATIAPVRRGVNFVGYRTWSSRRFVRRRALYNYRRALRQDRLDSAISILGHARRTHSLRHLLRYTMEHHNAHHRLLPEIYRRRRHAGAAPA